MILLSLLQLVGDGREDFPFSKWGMYSDLKKAGPAGKTLVNLHSNGLSINAMSNPRPILTAEYWLFLGGIVSMLFLTFMRYRFAWWPFHPVGFAFSGTIFTRLESFTILIAWLLKFLMLKIGGVAFYRRSMPFFIGILTGYIVAVIAGTVVDAIWFPYAGHRVHSWH